MPIYEFECSDCGCLTSIFTRSIGAAYEARCNHCCSPNLERALSRFAHHRSEQTILEEYGAEPQRLEDLRDSRQIGRGVERTFQEFGVEMPKEAREMIDAAREGEFPEPVEDL